MKNTLVRKYAILGSLLLVVLCMLGMTVAHAQSGYQPLTGLPGATEPDHINLAGYVNALFLISISIGGMLAVVRIALAGFQYMTSGLVSSKEKAREDITGALLGLGILLASFVVLYTINPELTNLDVLRGAQPVTLQGISNENQNGSSPTVTSCGPGDTACLNQCKSSGGTPVMAGGQIGIFADEEDYRYDCVRNSGSDPCTTDTESLGCRMKECGPNDEFVLQGASYICRAKQLVPINPSPSINSFSTSASNSEINGALSSYDARYASKFIGVYTVTYTEASPSGSALVGLQTAIKNNCTSKGGVLAAGSASKGSRIYCFGQFEFTGTQKQTTLNTSTASDATINQFAEQCEITRKGYITEAGDIMTCHYTE